MSDRRHTTRNDSTLGALSGLGVATAAWTLSTSPAVADLSFWVFLAAGMLVCPWQPRLPAFGAVTWRLPFVVSALVLFGVGAAVLAYLVGSLAAVLGRDERRSAGFVLGTLYDLASGTLVTVLASLAYLAAGGAQVTEVTGAILVPLYAFVLMHVVSDRLADALRVQTTRIPARPDERRGWLYRGLLTTGGTTAALVVTAAYLSPVTQPWLWILPSVGFVSYLHSSGADEERPPSTHLSPISRSIARALADALCPGREPDGTAGQRRALALSLGHRMGMDESELDGLETAAWLFDIDRLEVPPPCANRPAARKFRREPEIDVDETAVLDAIALPNSVRQSLTHRHERWDGAGVPDGLAGAQIPRGARILAVAGSYVSMTVGGIDRPPLAPHRALAELRDEAGRIFDPRAIESLAGHLRETCGGQEPDGETDRSDSAAAVAGGDAPESTRLPAVQRELYALYEIGRAVNYRLDLDENLTLILDKLESLVPHSSAVVFLEDPDEGGLRARFVRGIGASAVDGVGISSQASPSGTAFTEQRSTTGRGGRARMPYDPGEWDLDVLADSPLNAVLRSALASPLVFGGRCIGALTLYDRAGRRFGDEERRRVAAVAGHVARAVHNADPDNPGYLESLTDPLTGLPNGRYLEICSGDLLPSGSAGGTGFSLLAFRVRDLDRVCERSGIAAAERLLGVLARRLASNCTETEVPVRYGQDLFVVLSPSTFQEELVRRWDVLLRAAEGRPLELQRGQPHDLRLVSAHATCPAEGEDLDVLLDVLGTRLGLAFDRGHTVVPFRLVRSAG